MIVETLFWENFDSDLETKEEEMKKKLKIIFEMASKTIDKNYKAGSLLQV